MVAVPDVAVQLPPSAFLLPRRRRTRRLVDDTHNPSALPHRRTCHTSWATSTVSSDVSSVIRRMGPGHASAARPSTCRGWPSGRPRRPARWAAMARASAVVERGRGRRGPSWPTPPRTCGWWPRWPRGTSSDCARGASRDDRQDERDRQEHDGAHDSALLEPMRVSRPSQTPGYMPAARRVAAPHVAMQLPLAAFALPDDEVLAGVDDFPVGREHLVGPHLVRGVAVRLHLGQGQLGGRWRGGKCDLPELEDRLGPGDASHIGWQQRRVGRVERSDGRRVLLAPRRAELRVDGFDGGADVVDWALVEGDAKATSDKQSNRTAARIVSLLAVVPSSGL